MASFFDTLSKTATDAATRASAKADELIEVNKLKGKQADIKKEINMTIGKIGKHCFKKYKEGAEFDEELTKLCKHLERLQEDIKGFDEEIADTRERHRVKQAEADEERL